MKIYVQQGYGKMQDNDGNPIKYPINRIMLSNEKGTLTLKMDKTNRAVLPYFIKDKSEPVQIEDENGNTITQYQIQ